MNRQKLGTLIAVGTFALVSQTKANVITDTFADADLYNTTGLVGGGQSIGSGGSFTGNFNIETTDGTPTFTVSSTLYTHAIGGSGDTYNSTLGFNPLLDHVIDGVAKFWFHDTAHNSFTVDLALDNLSGTPGGDIAVLEESIGVSVIAKLNLDGNIDYLISNSGPGAIKLDYAYLGVDIATTPDGGTTAMLLGLGLLGVAGVRRKLS